MPQSLLPLNKVYVKYIQSLGKSTFPTEELEKVAV